ncbi:MAG: hypothetical protein H7096_12100 [Flavobacterium sp.]|nr:hypothetical protein [Pedobacter sp.]
MNAVKQDPSLYKIVVTHYITSSLCFLAVVIMMVFCAEDFSGHYFNPKLLAITHLAALGWGTMIILGASYQLLPVILETKLYSKILAWVSYVFFLPGIFCLVFSFWIFDPGIFMQSGSIFLLLAIVLYAVNVFFTADKGQQDSIAQDFIGTATLWLCFTALLGTLLVFNFQFPFLPKDHLDFLKLHAHMGIAGWFLLMIIGVSAKLLPMFLVSSYQNNQLLNLTYYLLNTALILFLVDTYLYNLNAKTYVIAFVGIAGIVCYLLFVYQCFKFRIRKVMDLPMASTFLSFGLLGIAISIIPFIIYWHLDKNPATIKYSMLYGTLLFMGWICALILNQTFKTLPFIVWVKHYEHLTGKFKTPMPADLVNNSLLKIQAISFVAFCCTFFPGIFFGFTFLIYAGLGALLVTAVMYILNVAGVILHKTRTENYDRI